MTLASRGWANRSGRPGSRIPAAASKSAAARASVVVETCERRRRGALRRQSRARSQRSRTPPPREEGGSRRNSTLRDTAPGLRRRIRSIASPDGAIPSVCSSTASSRTMNGLPPVHSWQARPKSASTGRPDTRSSNATVPGSLNRASSSTSHAGSAAISPNGTIRSAGLAPPDRGEHGDRHLLEPPHEVQQPAHRSLVAPLHVVNGNQERGALAHGRRQPVQAVMNLELGDPGLRTAAPQRIRGYRRRTAQQRASPSLGRT